VAIPGSKKVQPMTFLENYPERMIYISLVPEIGPVKSQWLKSGEPPLNDSFFQIEVDIRTLSLNAIRDCSNQEEEVRRGIFNSAISHVEKIMKEKDLYHRDTYNFYRDLLERFLFVCHDEIANNFPEDIFPDYEPKVTPDNLVDYMPSIGMLVDQLPEASIENLPDLMHLYEKYEKSASKNSGEWVEGNVVLGANPEDYQPTEDELLLGEIGDRIHEIATNFPESEIKVKLNKAKIRKRKIRYTRFSFIHMDVMGSGRFFYVASIDEVKIDFRK
jgi:hypothetical protein